MIAMAAENDPALAELQLSSKSEASVSRQVSKHPSSSSDSQEEEKSEEMFDEYRGLPSVSSAEEDGRTHKVYKTTHL